MSAPFDESMRYDYDLRPGSLVIDLGCHHGTFSKGIAERYDCWIEAYEPIKRFHAVAVANLFPYPKVLLLNAGVGPQAETADFTLQETATGRFASGMEHERVSIQGIRSVIFAPVGLIKINIEGSEFDLLDCMLDHDLVQRCLNIQVQFHDCIPDAKARHLAIRERLLKTHRLTYDYPFIWENYALNS